MMRTSTLNSLSSLSLWSRRYRLLLSFLVGLLTLAVTVFAQDIKIWLNGYLQLTGLNGIPTLAVFGSNNFNVNISAPLYLPENIQVGYAFTPNKKWMFEVDGAWYDWYAARQFGVVYKDNLTPAQAAVLAVGNPEQFKPRNTLSAAAGANYKYSDKLQLRAGTFYEGASQPESVYNPGFVDMPRYCLGAGFGYALTSKLTLDFAYTYVFYHTRWISNNLGLINTGVASNNINGSFDNHSQGVSLSLTMRLPGFKS